MGHEMILDRVSARKGPAANRAHVDIWVRGVEPAIARVEAIRGDDGYWRAVAGRASG